ncbi:MAG: YegS/Rv2252/BmrU family lipid kinase [Bacteroidota bacterium]|nr:YegS/Rv2252/BmrU family lipid kinase [Bacteroidota bacterium]
MRLKIHFIIKISNSKIAERIKEQVRIKFDENKYQVKISESSFKGETKTLARQAVLNKTDLIVACGGDGTINEIINEIKEKEFKIAIVPIGSGNGIARHFNIPLDISKSLDLILRHNYTYVDIGKVNESVFLGNVAFGIGADFIKNYHKIKYKGLVGYFLAFIKTIFSIKEKQFIIDIDGERITSSPLILIVSNTNQQGYNFTVTPKAKTDDGMLDMFIVENISYLKNIINIFKIILGLNFSPGESIYKKIENLNITLQKPIKNIQIDGENLNVNRGVYKIKSVKNTLQLITPN